MSISRTAPASFKSLLSIAAFNAGLFLLGVILLELIFGNWFVSFVLPNPILVNRTFTYPQQLYEPNGTVIHAPDKYGLRGLHQPISAVQLVTVGGSTTAQSFISEGETWQDVIHSLTRIVVANAGIDGAGSQSHPRIVEEWLHQIPDLKARYFLHYIGVNDTPMSQDVPLADQRRGFSWSRRIRARSAIWQVLTKIRGQFEQPGFVVHGSVIPGLTPAREPIRVQGDHRVLTEYIDRMYKPNLRILIGIHERHDETAILVSQTTNPALLFRQGGEVLVMNPELVSFAFALDPINAATQAVCGENPRSCRFIDLAGNISLEPSDFYDLVHNTPQGARKIGEFLSRKLDFVRQKE